MQYRQALPRCTRVCQQSHPILSSDAARGLYDASRMDELALIPAALPAAY
jgi:hypothetical protein